MSWPVQSELINAVDWSWLAGLLEGEAYFALLPSAKIALGMADRDVVERAATLMNTIVRHEPRRPKQHQDMWWAVICGEKALRVMRAVRPYMGHRRGDRIDECLARWDGRTGRGVNTRKFTPQSVVLARHLTSRGVSLSRLSQATGITVSAISRVVKGKFWRSVTYGLA